ncbi:MAG: glycosyltransferase [Candidatus Nanopelagicales bacterium]
MDLPWDQGDPTPIVLLSFSTVTEQASLRSLQSALDALGDLPVHVIGATAAVDPADLDVPPNASLSRYLDHEVAMQRAALVVGHGGHGTTMRALGHGLPIVGIPAGGVDQTRITELVQEWGAGRALPHDADADAIRDAAADILDHPSFRDHAARIAEMLEGVDGTSLAADSVESLLT